MGADSRAGIRSILIFLALWFLPANSQPTMTLRSENKCKRLPDINEFEMELRVYDEQANAVRLNAINDTKAIISTCNVDGTGTKLDAFVVKTTVSRSTHAELINECGVRVIQLSGNNGYQYDWKFKSYTYLETEIVHEQGVVINVHCTTEDITDGRVSTFVQPSLPTMQLTPANNADITGLDAVAVGSTLELNAYVYPDADGTDPELVGAVGFYVHTCYSATNKQMTQNKEQFINSAGCGVAGATYKPTTEFVQVAGASPLQVRAQFVTARLVNNKKKVYFQCSIGRCNSACTQRCGGLGGIETDVVYSTAITVQDVPAQTLLVTQTTSGLPAVLETAQEGDKIYLYSQIVTDGVDASTDMIGAQGFYVYSCQYSLFPNFKDYTEFIDRFGCVVSGTDFSPSSDFTSATSYVANSYVVKSGPFFAKKQTKYRVYLRCGLGLTFTANHPYHIERCGASGAISGSYKEVGFRELETSITITDATEPSILMLVQDDTGTLVNAVGRPAYVGEPLELSMVIDPDADDAPEALASAEGAFVYACYGAELEEGELITEVPDDRRSFFINARGCVIEGSLYAPSEECKLVSEPGVSPFEISCGNVQVSEKGKVGFMCESGYCTTADSRTCQNRCAQGAIAGDAFAVEADIPLTTDFLVQERDLRRTAVRSNEIVTIIVALCIVLPVLFVIVVLAGSAYMVWKQRRRVKEDKDDRSYNYEN